MPLKISILIIGTPPVVCILSACKKCDLVKEDFSKKRDQISESQVKSFLLPTIRRLYLRCFQAFKFTTNFADQELRLQSDSNLELKPFLPVPLAHNLDRPLYLFNSHQHALACKFYIIMAYGKTFQKSTPPFGQCLIYSPTPHLLGNFIYVFERQNVIFVL